ncbi:MAG TPA: nuclear transport factor 2 family protein [Bacteroidota bacterium]|nr:nuclear transport factor 2 family protein [Bacteroidota bacterium]
MPSSRETVLAFIQAINRHEIATITNLMTTDHEFVDSLDGAMRGKDAMRQAWIAYFFLIPDYTITVLDLLAQGEVVVVTGRAGGTVAASGALPPENRWEVPLAIRAEVRDGKVARWQAFTDNEPVRAILNRQ